MQMCLHVSPVTLCSIKNRKSNVFQWPKLENEIRKIVQESLFLCCLFEDIVDMYL